MAQAMQDLAGSRLHPRTVEELQAGKENLANMASYRPASDRHPWLAHTEYPFAAIAAIGLYAGGCDDVQAVR